MSNGERASPDWDALTEAAQIRPDLLHRSHVVQAPSFKRRSEHIQTARKRRRSESWV
jgi:hypothetical protein